MELLVIDVPEEYVGVVTSRSGCAGKDAEDAEQRPWQGAA